jgi:hypothetical protein
MPETWEQLRNTEGLRLGPAAFRWQSCVKCNAEIDTLLGGGMASHRDFNCQPSFKPQVGPYDEAVQRALRGL